MTDWFEAIREERKVRGKVKLVTGGADVPDIQGVVVAYSHAPQVLIKTPDGRMVWWRADMTEIVEES